MLWDGAMGAAALRASGPAVGMLCWWHIPGLLGVWEQSTAMGLRGVMTPGKGA